MGNNDSKEAGNNDTKVAGSGASGSDFKGTDRNATIKLIFPSHGLPFAIPFSILPRPVKREWPLQRPSHELKIGIQELVSKIDEILKDMEKKSPNSRESWKLKLPSGRILESPSPGDWVLIDVDNSLLIHNSLLTIQVVGGGTYLVLPMRGSDISAEDLKEAIKAVKTTTRLGEDVLPIYTSG